MIEGVKKKIEFTPKPFDFCQKNLSCTSNCCSSKIKWKGIRLFGKEFSSCDAGDGPSDGDFDGDGSIEKNRKKRAKLDYQSNSVGNKSLSAVVRKNKRSHSKTGKTFEPPPVKSFDDLAEMFKQHVSCCKDSKEKGCFMNIFKLVKP